MSSNYYACLSLPPCQVEEQKTTHPPNPPSHSFQPVMVNPQSPRTPPTRPHSVGHQGWPSAKHHANCMQARTRLLQTCTSYSHLQEENVIGDNDDILRRGIADGTIPSTVVDSGCTSGVGTSDDPRVNARAVPPTKSSYSPEVRSWQQPKSQSTLSKFGTPQNSCISRLASPRTHC